LNLFVLLAQLDYELIANSLQILARDMNLKVVVSYAW